MVAEQYVRGRVCDSPRGWTALMCAAIGGRTDCMRLLIDAGADKDAKSVVRVYCYLLQFSFSFVLFIHSTFHVSVCFSFVSFLSF